MNEADLTYELDEALAEIERHHRDFKAVSISVHNALEQAAYSCGPDAQARIYKEALEAIRRVVG